jgi:2-iminobutanoate/2-iminopropanoate deaminase
MSPMRTIITRLSLCALLLGGLAFAQKQAIVPKESEAPSNAPKLPFSPGILVGKTLYVSGQTGRDPKTGQIPSDFESEVKSALENAGAVLKAAGYDFKDAAAVQVYLTDMDMFQRMNAVYATYFPEPRPTRTTVGVAKLAGTAHVEITITAAK